MSTVVHLLRIALQILSAAWDLANDPKVEADIEALQVDLHRLITDIETDLDNATKLTVEPS